MQLAGLWAESYNISALLVATISSLNSNIECGNLSRGTQEFQRCVTNTVWRRCPENSDALSSIDVVQYTEELFDKYNYTCQSTMEIANGIQ